MTLPLVLEPEAKAEFDDAHDWYEGQQNGLGKRFRTAVRDCLTRLRKRALAHQVMYPPDIRRMLVRKFPYAVFYRVTATEIRVISIFDTRRDPAGWQQRVDDHAPPENGTP